MACPPELHALLDLQTDTPLTPQQTLFQRYSRALNSCLAFASSVVAEANLPSGGPPTFSVNTCGVSPYHRKGTMVASIKLSTHAVGTRCLPGDQKGRHQGGHPQCPTHIPREPHTKVSPTALCRAKKGVWRMEGVGRDRHSDGSSDREGMAVEMNAWQVLYSWVPSLEAWATKSARTKP